MSSKTCLQIIEDKPTCSFKQFEQIIGSTNYKIIHGVREGQTIMNILNNVWPQEYKRLVTTVLDCFYNDKIIKFTLEHLRQVWR